ncbi:hypothetical protein FQA39_LY05612 [Lamprigera yunnana]|nr:hypothetical protein FQA39_LY05612 [Lamprigera yunnana]
MWGAGISSTPTRSGIIVSQKKVSTELVNASTKQHKMIIKLCAHQFLKISMWGAGISMVAQNHQKSVRETVIEILDVGLRLRQPSRPEENLRQRFQQTSLAQQNRRLRSGLACPAEEALYPVDSLKKLSDSPFRSAESWYNLTDPSKPSQRNNVYTAYHDLRLGDDIARPKYSDTILLAFISVEVLKSKWDKDAAVSTHESMQKIPKNVG